jgi:beta-glucosidase-like glycosyl hydrolase/CubicO group peptidase (beta-lactamase class C family)
LFFFRGFSQNEAQKWADSVYEKLTDEERIGQLIVVRLSKIDPKTKKRVPLTDQVEAYVKKYNVGGVCLFQGSPTEQAMWMNRLKKMARTPILFSIDGEWGLSMRIPDSIIPLPRQMMLGALSDSSIVYEYGKVVANQCKRMGIQMNYAPVIDVNNNPNNPVINDRSFGEVKEKVARFGIQYIKGMEDNGVMACVKHFPGHGDVAVDSHLDLPVINKSLEELEQLEFYPFRKAFEAGVSSAMIAHLYIPSIDNRSNRATSLSKNNIDTLLRQEFKFNGLAITDGLEMKGVKKFFPDGELAVEAIMAGNDLLCIPDSVPQVVEKLMEAVKANRITAKEIETHCKKVLLAKYQFVLQNNDTVALQNLTSDLNKEVPVLREKIAEQAITLVSKEDALFFPLDVEKHRNKLAYVAVGIKSPNAITKQMESTFGASVFYFDFNVKNKDSIARMKDSLIRNYQAVVVGIHQINRAPANNFGISNEAVTLVRELQEKTKALTIIFGNAYAAKNWNYAPNLVVAYEDDSIVQKTMMRLLLGKINYRGVLPVTVSDNLKSGKGIFAQQRLMQYELPSAYIAQSDAAIQLDSTVEDAIKKKALPGCVVLATKNGKVIFEKAYGHHTYLQEQLVQTGSIYDLASLTKILATTLAIMRMYDEGCIDLNRAISHYLPEIEHTNKANIPLYQLLLHEGGLIPYIPYYKETLDDKGNASDAYFTSINKDCNHILVAEDLYIDERFIDTFYQRILSSEVSDSGKYVYSDNDFILLGKIVERQSGLSLDEYCKKYFYVPMGLNSISYLPLDKMRYERIIPSTKETGFRNKELRGYVHDQGSAIMGGIAGHAGLFGNAYDIACLMQMLIDKGTWGDKKYINKETIEKFTAYQGKSRRGLGFDKPEKDNETRAEPYPSALCSSQTFGHTGFTGTCVWADPKEEIIFVFLSNRIYQDQGVFKTLNLRSKVQDCVYRFAKDISTSPLQQSMN